MNAGVPSLSGVLACALLVGPLSAGSAEARDYGRLGAVFPVLETDMLAMIEGKLLAARADGTLARMQRDWAAKTEAKVRRPVPVRGVSTTTEPRRWTHDPSITVGKDIRDANGRVIVARGTHVNPLDHVRMRQSLVFIDGDDPAQVAWAMHSTTDLNAKIVLTRGAPLAVMDANKRRVYFDQNGVITAKFGIHHVPAVVDQKGKTLLVTELLTPRPSSKVSAQPASYTGARR